MTPSPVVEVTLVGVAGILAALALTYAVHSTLVIAAAMLTARLRPLASVDRVHLWRAAIVLPFVTTLGQTMGVPLLIPVQWALVDLAPQPFVDWRAGIAGVALVLFGAFVLAAQLTAGAIAMRRLFGRRRAAPAHLQDDAAALAVVLDCVRPLVTVSDRSPVPAAMGLREVCLPSALLASTAQDERRALLAHELAHVAHRDPMWNGIATALVSAGAFQPLNRLALRRLRAAAEDAADDAAAAVTGDPMPLARALTALTESIVEPIARPAATGAPIVERVARLLDPATPRPPVLRRRTTRVVSALALTLMLTLAPGVTPSIGDLANRLPWLTPSRDEPHARLLEFRRAARAWRADLRSVLR